MTEKPEGPGRAGPPKRIFRLTLKMSAVVAVGLVLGMLLYAGINAVGNYYIDHIYCSETASAQRQNALADSFRDYAQSKGLTSRDLFLLKAWCREQPNMQMTLLQGSRILLTTDGTWTDGPYYATPQEADPSDWYDSSQILYPVQLRDGLFYITFFDYSFVHYYSVFSIVSIVGFFIGFLILVLLYTARVTRRVSALSRRVARVTNGDLDTPVEACGNDEIYLLAADVESMRASMVDRLHGEQAAWKANSELITAISHDIRNPLTSLIGYADLLANDQVADPALCRHYLATCRDKAYQLKYLTDQLFGYFLVFGNNAPACRLEPVNGRILTEQLLGEATARLAAEGYLVRSGELEKDCIVCTDVMLLKRIFDNLFSNIEKYADRSVEVEVSAKLEPKCLSVTLRNGIAAQAGRVESNRIGLKTCEKIADLLGVGFENKSEKGIFIARLTVPLADSEAKPLSF